LKIEASAVWGNHRHTASVSFMMFLSVFSFCYWYAIMLTAFILWTKPTKEVSVETWLFLSLAQVGTVPTYFWRCNSAPKNVTLHLVGFFQTPNIF